MPTGGCGAGRKTPPAARRWSGRRRGAVCGTGAARRHSLRRLPEFLLRKGGDVVNGLVAAAAHAGGFVGLDRRHDGRIGAVDDPLLERTGACVTVEALAIAVRRVEVQRRRGVAE